jgi:hypothetical protein
MKKHFIYLLFLVFAFSACQVENDEKTVTYFVKGFTEPYKVVYTYGEDSKTKTETIDPAGSIDYTWQYSFSDLPGEICYIYIESDEDISNSMRFNTSILINRKTHQKAVSYDKTTISGTDTVSTIKRSMTIPF